MNDFNCQTSLKIEKMNSNEVIPKGYRYVYVDELKGEFLKKSL